MKNIVLILFLAISANVFAQQKLTYSNKSFEPVVFPAQGLSQSEIYKRLKLWVNNYYQNPEKVLMVDDQDNIRINAIASRAFLVKQLGQELWYNLKYNLNIQIKENRYRVSFSPDGIRTSSNVPLSWDLNYYYKKNGKLKKMGEEMPRTLNKHLAMLSASISRAVKTGKAGSSNDDW